MKKLFILFLLISLIGTVGCGAKDGGEAEAKDPGNSKEEITYVKVAAVGTADFVKSLSLPGTLKPSEEVVITSKVTGTVDYVNVDIGDRVQEGEMLCKINDFTYRIQYKQAKTALNMQQITGDDTKKNYQRQKELYENNAVSKVQFEAAEKQYKMAQEQLDNAQYNYDLALNNLNDTDITAPITGTVSFKDVSTGENIGPSKAILKIVNTNPMYIETGVAEKNIGYIKKGQKVLINVDSVGDKELEGQVTHIGPVPDQQNKTYPMKVLVENNGLLKAGMVANIDIEIAKQENKLAVPQKAVVTENDRNYVFTVQNGKAVKKEVELGLSKPLASGDMLTEIIKGLEKGEKVVVVGNSELKDGSLVDIR